MKKTRGTLLLFIVLGLLAGTIIGQLLESVSWLSFMTKSTQISWEPKADLQVIKYDLQFLVKLNLIGILGAVGSIWIYRNL